ncbi:MAG: efflux RND transporter periplasmic adaptor subunit [Alphaproteobacteria bacterium]|nr:efflux RND transporter periplasmic adaptor subunit [Alphaproteobacteria bacterium]MDE2495450.1 efflux RND transporter periplasmic adaptor subunit [Alphaproteobacteria bacterium]
MNIRFAGAFDVLPARVQSFPRALGRLSSRARLIGGLLAGVFALALAWYFLGSGGEGRKARLPPVVVATAVSKNVTVVEHTIGTVVANATVQITACVSGELIAANFKEGQIVHTGDLLFRIDPKPFEAALEQARAQLAKDSAQLASAQNDQQRYNALFAQNAASSQQRDQADAAAKSLAATVAADRGALDIAKLNLGYTEIRSPIDGKTGPILIQPGNLVSANGSNALVVITQIQPVKVAFSLPQTELPQIQERERAHDLTAFLSVHAANGAPLTAPVNFIDNEVNAQTGTIELRAAFDNLDQRLVPGQLVDVAVSLKALKNATVVPREAVNDGPNGRYVFVVTPDGTADMRPVDVLFDDGTNMAVSGKLKRGDKVVVDGQFGVTPGDKVSIVRGGNGMKETSAKSPQ